MFYENPSIAGKKTKKYPYVIKYDDPDVSDEEVDLPDSDIEILDSSSNGRIPLRPTAFTLNEAYDAISKYTDWSSKPGSTQDTYKQRLYPIMELLKCDTFDDMVMCFKDIEHIHTIFVEKFAYGAKDYFGVIHTLNKASPKYRQLMGKDLLEKYKKYERDYVELYKQEAFTKTEFESAIPIKSLVKAHDVLKRKDPISMQTLVTRMYLDRALRDNFGDVRMIYRQKEDRLHLEATITIYRRMCSIYVSTKYRNDMVHKNLVCPTRRWR